MTSPDLRTVRDSATCQGQRCPDKRPGGLVHCPAHDDNTPSLSVTAGDTVPVVVKCFGNCPQEDVIAAFKARGVWPSSDDRGMDSRQVRRASERAQAKAERRIVATYDYTDETDKLTFQVVKYAPKDFRQRRPDGAGEWVWNLNGIEPVLFHLPRIAEAVAAGETVYLAEGEKDVLALEAAGVVATCNPMGAGKWRESYTESLRGASEVAIVQDRDEAGRKHAVTVLTALTEAGIPARIVEAAEGKDASDHLAAGFGIDEFHEPSIVPVVGRRHLQLVKASSITIRPVQWLWKGRLALGTLGLVAGREGLGKSTWAYGQVADITRGRLPGCYDGTPKAVIIAATEDSWEHTIVPRLMAAGADLDLVYRIDVVTSEGTGGYLSLPKDNVELEAAVASVSAALILLDPLLSRLDADLDSHKDAEVRVALEPLVAIADRAGAAIWGLIHVNKSSSSDPLTTIMASRAFAAVARSVLMFARDPEDEGALLVGLEKNNLGRADLPTLRLRIEGVHVADTAEGPVWSSRTVLTGETDVKIRDVMADNALAPDDRTAADEAADWLSDYLEAAGGSAESSQVKAAGKSAGHSLSTLNRARRKLRATAESQGFPRRTWWRLRQSIQPVGESESTGITESTDGISGASGFSRVSDSVPPARANQLDEFTCSWCPSPVTAYDAFGRPVCGEHAEAAEWIA